MRPAPSFSFYYLILAISVFGLINGSALGLLFHRHRWCWYGAAGAVLAFLSEEVYSWYRLGYADTGALGHAAGYGACVWIVANIVMVLPLLAVGLLSFITGHRRIFSMLGAAAAAGALSFALYGVFIGGTKEEIHVVPVAVADLPASFEGYRIAQITDAHIGPYYRYEDLDSDLAAAISLHVSLVAVTGDLIDDNRFMPDVTRVLRARGRSFLDGMVYVWGNHEYFHDRSEVREGLWVAGVPILENSSRRVDHGGESLYLAGVDYPWSRGEEKPVEEAAMAEQAFSGVPKGAVSVFLTHHPDFIDKGFQHGAALTMAGHTHGMQIGLFGKPLFSPYKYTRGFYENSGLAGYVSRGNGFWFPFRFGCSREMVIYELHRA